MKAARKALSSATPSGIESSGRETAPFFALNEVQP